MNLLNAYTRMLELRIAEEELIKLYMDKKLFSMVHFYVGEEASAVGVCDALEADDKVFGNHRSHGHYLAKGGNFKRMVAELVGRKGGLAKGKGGSMHMIDKSVNFAGSTPLLGSVAPIAAGSAFEQKYNHKKTITAAFYGDGASEEGVVYETYHLASLYKLPLLLVIENNGHSINSRTSDRRGDRYDLRRVLAGFGVEYRKADGNDYSDVYTHAKELADYVRRESRPAVLEVMVYRHMAHSTPLMEERYRDIDTAEMRAKSDPLTKLKNALLAEGTSEAELEALANGMRVRMRKEIEEALEMPYPDKDEMYEDVFAQ